MDLRVKTKNLPKDARWQDLVPQLKCPQCQIYSASNQNHLERHIILHCKSRNSLLRNHYIRKIKALSSQVEDDPVELVRLTLEAKLLQWQKEGMPEIPLLLRQPQLQVLQENEKNNSPLLDLWRLWIQELDTQSLEHEPYGLLQLLAQAETLDWEPSEEATQPTSQVDDQLNSELMDSTSLKLKNLLAASIKEVEDPQNIDIAAIERLENEAFMLATMLK